MMHYNFKRPKVHKMTLDMFSQNSRPFTVLPFAKFVQIFGMYKNIFEIYSQSCSQPTLLEPKLMTQQKFSYTEIKYSLQITNRVL